MGVQGHGSGSWVAWGLLAGGGGGQAVRADRGGHVSQANLKKFMDYVQLHSTDKVARLLDKGLDPNFHDPDSGGEQLGGRGCGLGVAGA